MTDHEQGAVERYMANRRESHVDLGTVPCGICGERVRIGMNGVWSEYHDCKPVPLARLQQAERERDEARAEVARLRHDPKADARQVIEEWRAKAERAWSDAGQAQERLEKATALLREAMSDLRYLNALPGEQGQDDGLVDRIDAFLAGQPEPAKVAVDDAMVERAQTAYTDAIVKSLSCNNDTMKEHPMHAALVVALEGQT